MKKTLFAISAIAMLLGFTACTSENENIEPQAKGKKVIIYANTEEPTRATLGEGDETNGYPVVWEAGDAFSIFILHEMMEEKYWDTKTFTLKSGEGTTKGTFECENFYDEGTFNAYYGYDGTNWPTTQNYCEGNITGMPMVAENVTIDWDGNLPTQVFFKNVGGILRLNLKGTAKIMYIQVEANELTNPVTLACGSGVTLSESTAIPFHIALPTNDYTGLKFKFYNESGFATTMALKAGKTLKVERSKITNVNLTLTKEFSTPEETITASSPVGTIGMLDGRQGIVVDLGGTIGQVVIATMNVGATSIYEGAGNSTASCYGDYIKWEDACAASTNETWGDGWYLPSKDELAALVPNLKKNDAMRCCVWNVTESSALYLPAAGYYNVTNVMWAGDMSNGVYLSSTHDPEMESRGFTDFSYTLSFDGVKISSGWNSRGYSVRPFHAMPEAPASSYNMGDKVTLDGHDGIVVELNGTKVAVATMNVKATSVNDARCSDFYLTYANACAAIWSGWRLPTLEEFEALCLPESKGICGNTIVGEHYVPMMMWDLNNNGEIDLYLPLYDNDEDADYNPYDKYWTGTPGNDDTQYYFAPEIEFEGDYAPVYWMYYISNEAVDKDNEYLVRLFHDL